MAENSAVAKPRDNPVSSRRTVRFSSTYRVLDFLSGVFQHALLAILIALPLIACADIKFGDEHSGVYVQVLRRNDFVWNIQMQDYSTKYPLLRPAAWFGDPLLSWRTIASTPQSTKHRISLQPHEVVRFSNVRVNHGTSGSRYPITNSRYIDDAIELFKQNRDVILHYSDPPHSDLKLDEFHELLRNPNIRGFEFDTRNEKLFDSDWVAELMENPNLVHLALDVPSIESKTLIKLGRLSNLRSLSLRLGNSYRKWYGEDLARMISSLDNLTQFTLVFTGAVEPEKVLNALGTRKYLRELYLEGDFWNEEPLQHISKIRTLEKLCFVNTTQFELTDELLLLSDMPVLEHLEIHGAAKLERRHLEHFCEMKSLKVLRIGGRSDVRTDLGGLSAFDWTKIFKSQLSTLWLDTSGYKDAMIESFDRMKNLQTLVLSGNMSMITSRSWERLLRSQSLSQLEIDATEEGVQFSSVGAVLKSRTLVSVMIRNLIMTEEDRFEFSLPNRIARLCLELPFLPYGALRKARWEFETLDRLESLSISCPTWVVQADAMKYFDECRNLKLIVLAASDIEDPVSFAIATDAFPKLETLCLTGFKLNNEAMKRIEDRRELRVFAFAPEDIEAVKRVSNLRGLQNLALSISGDILLDFTPHALKDVDDLKQLKSLMLAIDEPGEFMFEKLLGETSDSTAEDVCINYGPGFRDFATITCGNTAGAVEYPLQRLDRRDKPK